MALVKCPECGKERVSSMAEACPQCGFNVKKHFENIAEIEVASDKVVNEKESVTVSPTKKKSIETILIGFCIVFFGLLTVNMISQQAKTEKFYKAACELYATGEYRQAYNMFKELEDYKDASEFVHDLKQEYPILTYYDAEIGDGVYLGKYEQDNNLDNGPEPIRWIVLDRSEDQILVVSQYVLECMAYNAKFTDVTWETCSLRRWLNNDFLNIAFDNDEQMLIQSTVLYNHDNPTFGTNGGDNTTDNIFVLSVNEAEKYLMPSYQNYARPSKYVEAEGVYIEDGYCSQWLRTPGYTNSFVSLISTDGEIHGISDGYGGHGAGVDGDIGPVRPALWIDLTSENQD